MTTRRSFLATTVGLTAAAVLPNPLRAVDGSARRASAVDGRHEPWLEVDPDALRSNARELRRRAGNRPLIAMVKNNGYGLGVGNVALALEPAAEVDGFGVVKPDEAFLLREVGVRKPILYLGLPTTQDAVDMARLEIRLMPGTDDAPELFREVARQLGRPVPVHVKIDTGLGRLGVPYYRALPWIERLVGTGAVEVEGTFMTFTESDAFDPEQVERFVGLATALRARGLPTGRLHAASSNAVFRLPAAHLDMVRPGLSLYGAYPSEVEPADRLGLTPAFRLRARLVRVEQIRPGDAVGYGRNFIAQQPTWIGTIPIGHADGWPRNAPRGAEVLIGGRTYPVIGAVGASHTMVDIGAEKSAEVGDVVTLLGPDHPAVHPNTHSERAGRSVYDTLMHLSPLLPVRVLRAT
jgi:alanine racemase